MTSRRRLLGPMILATALALTSATSPARATDDCNGTAICAVEDQISARLRGVEFIRVPGKPSPKSYLYTSSCYIENEVRTADGCIDGSIPEPPEPCTTGLWMEPRWAQLRDSGDGTPGP